METVSLGGGSPALHRVNHNRRATSYNQVRSESRSWDVTGDGDSDAAGHEYVAPPPPSPFLARLPLSTPLLPRPFYHHQSPFFTLHSPRLDSTF